jgi:hypothetical protein
MSDIIEPQHINRRDVVKELAVATLVIALAPLVQACDSVDEERSAAGSDALVVTTTEGLLGHVHDLSIDEHLLESPPAEGVAIETTRSLFHRHTIQLSADELLAIKSGNTVTRQISSHHLAICLDCARRSPPA